ncbi:pyruvate/2-oxoglutarate dehydrogenase complex dihydrolipoamide acyltransferase (E2) component [Frigoribacterium sp. PvP054]|uniref:excalibur calcium-binding domain-containing protein n=1 Tax=Frigoribacterium sp. PvP054 TaxID=3156438 RepID=UPI0033936EC3
MTNVNPPTSDRRPRGFRPRYIGYALVALALLLGLVSSGLSGLLIMAGLLGGGFALYTVVSGRKGLLGFPSRGAGALASVGAVIVLVVGGVVAPAPSSDPSTAAGESQSVAGFAATSQADKDRADQEERAKVAADIEEEKRAKLEAERAAADAEAARIASEEAAQQAAAEQAAADQAAAAAAAQAEADRVAAEQAATAQAEADRVAAEQAAAAAAAQAPARSTSTYYANCTAARAAGAAPVRVGDPGYASHLDRDGDGIGCE